MSITLFKNKIASLLLITATVLTACNVSKRIVSREANKQLLEEKNLSSALIGIALYDLDKEKYIYQYQSEKSFTPASNVKLFTWYAAMKYLGDSISTFNYIIRSDSSLFVQPLADPTFLHPDFTTQLGYSFLKKFKSIYLSYSDTAVQSIGTGWAWDDYMESYSAQQSLFPIYSNLATISSPIKKTITIQPSYFAKNIIVKPTFISGFNVFKNWDNNLFTISSGLSSKKRVPFTPDINTTIGLLADTLHIPTYRADSLLFFDTSIAQSLQSQKTDEVLQKMMYDSDNFIAEQCLLMTGLKKWNKTRTQDIIDTLLRTDFKNLPQPLRLVDASGMSRYSLCTPQNFIHTLHAIKNEFGWDRITITLPTGNQGTLAGYYKDYVNYIYAKTGTLSNNISLSGYLLTRQGKHLAFSILVNHHNTSSKLVRQRIESFITQIIEKY